MHAVLQVVTTRANKTRARQAVTAPLTKDSLEASGRQLIIGVLVGDLSEVMQASIAILWSIYREINCNNFNKVWSQYTGHGEN